MNILGEGIVPSGQLIAQKWPNIRTESILPANGSFLKIFYGKIGNFSKRIKLGPLYAFTKTTIFGGFYFFYHNIVIFFDTAAYFLESAFHQRA